MCGNIDYNQKLQALAAILSGAHVLMGIIFGTIIFAIKGQYIVYDCPIISGWFIMSMLFSMISVILFIIYHASKKNIDIIDYVNIIDNRHRLYIPYFIQSLTTLVYTMVILFSSDLKNDVCIHDDESNIYGPVWAMFVLGNTLMLAAMATFFAVGMIAHHEKNKESFDYFMTAA